MTLTSIVKLSTAVAFAATAAAAGAQVVVDPAPGAVIVVPSNSGTTTVDTITAPPTYTGGAPSAALSERTVGNLQAACAGLSDRQTERSCKQDRHRGIDDRNPSKIGNDAGNSDDQAD